VRGVCALNLLRGLKLAETHTSQNYWRCAYTKRSEERTASYELSKLGFETFVPIIVRDKRDELTKEIMFPRYVFVRIDLAVDGWQRTAYARGVSHLVGSSVGVPYRMRDDVMTQLRERCSNDGELYVKELEKGAQVSLGDLARVVSGPFTSFEGICVRGPKDRVTLMLMMFGTARPVALNQSEVEKVMV